MKLMQELITTSKPQVKEGYFTSSDLERFKKSAVRLEQKLDEIEPMFTEGSNFAKLVEKLGGDMAIFRDAKDAFDKLYRAAEDLHMSTDIAASSEDPQD